MSLNNQSLKFTISNITAFSFLVRVAASIVIFSGSQLSAAPVLETKKAEATQPMIQATFSEFSQILEKFVTIKTVGQGGLVSAFDYVKAYADPQFHTLRKTQQKRLNDFELAKLNDKNTAVAFWINVYNFQMIQKIVNDGFKDKKLKIKSVRDLGSFLDKYKAFKEEDFNIGGKKLSLDGVEKGILLDKEYKKKGWKDARIHFAVNCASAGCPPLLKEIYTPETLDKVLNDNLMAAFKTPRHFKFEGENIRVTQLFQWYKNDFVEAEGSVKKFIAKYVDLELREKVLNSKEIKYTPYDWDLNSPKNMF